MPRRSTLEIAEPKIIKYFSKLTKEILTYNQIEEILEEHKGAWRLANSITVNKLIDFLKTETQLKEVQIKFPSTLTPNFIRYYWGNLHLLP